MTSPSSRSPLRWLPALLAPLLFALAACATPFSADVKRFTTRMPAPSGQTFAVVAEDPADAGGIEFSQYADLVAAQMSRLGYVRSDPANASMIVRFGYDVDSGRDRVRTSPGLRDPFWSPWYGPRFGFGGYYGPFVGPYRRLGAWGYGWYDPFFFDSGYDVDVITVFTSEATLKIDRKADGQRLFEGQAQAVSRSDRLGYLVPNLVEALFTNFPGNSGEIVRISIAPEDGKKTIRPVRERERARY